METGIITISDNKKDFIKEKVNDSAQMRCLMFQSLSSICSVHVYSVPLSYLSKLLLLLQENKPLYLRLGNRQKNNHYNSSKKQKKVNNQKVLSEAHKYFEKLFFIPFTYLPSFWTTLSINHYFFLVIR